MINIQKFETLKQKHLEKLFRTTVTRATRDQKRMLPFVIEMLSKIHVLHHGNVPQKAFLNIPHPVWAQVSCGQLDVSWQTTNARVSSTSPDQTMALDLNQAL
jgi:hypothetical protein